MKRVLGFLLGVLLSVPVLAADCSVGQQPWSAVVDGQSGTGSSAWEACGRATVAKYVGGHATTNETSTCVGRDSSGQQPKTGSVTQVCTVPASSSSVGTVTVSVTAGTMTFPDIFQIDSEGGSSIAGAILAVWAVAWGFRMVIRTLNVDGKTSTSESES